MSLCPAVLPLIGLLLTVPDVGQTPPPPAEQTDVVLTEASQRLTVPVQIAGAGPFRFVIDTGAERTVISRQLANRLGLPAGRDVNVMAMSGSSRVGTVMVPSVRLSSVPDIGMIQSPALDANHLGALGLLGIDTLQDHKVTIDFDTTTMSLTPSSRRTKRVREAPGEIVVRAKGLAGQLIVTDADVDGQQVRVVLDTGSAVSIGNTALMRLMRRSMSATTPMEMTSALGGIVRTDFARASRLRLGGVVFTEMPVAFADVPPFASFGLAKKPALLLGMNALKMFRRVDIDFSNREVRFLMPRGNLRSGECTVRINARCAS